MAGASKFYKRTAKLLDNRFFCMFIADSNTPGGLAAATAYLIDALTYTGAPERLCAHETALNDFLSWAGDKENLQLFSSAFQDAFHIRHKKGKAQISAKQWMVYSIGLDWKSPQQHARRELLFDQMCTNHAIHAEHLAAPYPPAQNWIAESQDIHDKWHAHLSSGKLHDSRTSKHLPIHMLDWAKLQDNVMPDQDRCVWDHQTGRFCLIVCLKDYICHRRVSWICQTQCLQPS